jgi:hypothetical protein
VTDARSALGRIADPRAPHDQRTPVSASARCVAGVAVLCATRREGLLVAAVGCEARRIRATCMRQPVARAA